MAKTAVPKERLFRTAKELYEGRWGEMSKDDLVKACLRFAQKSTAHKKAIRQLQQKIFELRSTITKQCIDKSLLEHSLIEAIREGAGEELTKEQEMQIAEVILTKCVMDLVVPNPEEKW